jgi:hypothetical protein
MEGGNVMMLQAATLDIKTMFTNGAFRCLDLNGPFPNQLWYGEDPDAGRIGPLVIFRSRVDFPLGQAAFERLRSGLHDGKLDHAYVVQMEKAERQRKFIASIEAEKLVPILSSLNLQTGRFGPYWWLPEGFTSDFGRPAEPY